MPSVNSSSMPKVLDSSTVMTPSLPTLSTASAIFSPISGSAAEMAPTWAISSFASTSFAMVLDALDRELGGPLDAALQRHRVRAGRDVAQAFLHDRLREHGRGGRAVTGDVVGLLGDLLDELRADLLERVVELDLLGDRDAVVGDRGRAPLLLEDDVAALGAERDLDGVRELVHAALERPPRLLVERDELRCHPPTSLCLWPVSVACLCRPVVFGLFGRIRCQPCPPTASTRWL